MLNFGQLLRHPMGVMVVYQLVTVPTTVALGFVIFHNLFIIIIVLKNKKYNNSLLFFIIYLL